MIYNTNEEKKTYQGLQKIQHELNGWDLSKPLSELQIIYGLEIFEKTSLLFRKLCIFHQINPLEISQRNLAITAEVKPEGWLKIELPILLPKKKVQSTLKFLSEPLSYALLSIQDHSLFPIRFAHVCFIHLYHDSDVRDHDNIETKKVLDCISEFCLVDDDGLHCAISHFSFKGERDETKVFVMPQNNYKKWLEKSL